MPSETHIEARVKSLNAILTEKHGQAVGKALRAANGDMPVALTSLKGKLPAAALKKVALAHSLAVWSDDHVSLVKALSEQADITNLRDVALHFNVKKLAALVDSKTVSANTVGATVDEKKKNFAIALQNKLFTAEPTAVLHRMVLDAEVPIADVNQRKGVASFLSNQPEFNIRTSSVYTALKHPDAFKGIADEHRPGVVEQLKTLQRVQAISPTPAAVPALMKANLTSAFRIAEIPESTFLKAHGPTLGEDTARQVYTTAINTHIRNEHALMTMREAWRGTGLAIIDGQQPMEARMAKLQGVVDAKAVPLNLEALFGSIDFCECEDCLSVYSPAAYFVEILQYLRNNNLGSSPNTGKKGIEGTPLEKLFRRRPDLGCLELTCENTFTVLPYIDLVNEVMESFVVHLDKYETDTHIPKQATLEVFNVLDETTSELLAQPQHVNYQAYCILKDAVYPFTLPYHQPIDAIRIWLKYMGTSRYELLDTFRTATETVSGVVLTPAQQQALQKLHATVLDRSADSEFLGITQEEHIILTREAFWPKAYFDFTLQKVHTDQDYQKNIGVRPVHEYYGYKKEADMLSMIRGEKWITLNRDEVGMLGMSSQQMSDAIRHFSGASVQVFAHYSPESAQLRIYLVRMERRPDGRIYISYGDYTPHHGERLKAYRQFLTRAEKAVPGTPGWNPFGRFRGANTDPVFYNIDGAGMLTAIGYAMREYKAPTAWLAIAQGRLATRTESSGNFFRRTVTTYVEGFVKPSWYLIAPEQMIPAAVSDTGTFTGQICADSSLIVIEAGIPRCDWPEHYVYSGIWAQEWTGGNLPEAEAKIYEWSTTRSGFSILSFVLVGGPLTGDGSYGILRTVFGSGGSLTQAQDGFLGSTGDGFLTVAPPRSEQEAGMRAAIVDKHVAVNVDAGLAETRKMYVGNCATNQSSTECAAAGQDPGIVYRVDSYTEPNPVMTARDRYDQCKLTGFTGAALQRCAAPMPAGVFGTP